MRGKNWKRRAVSIASTIIAGLASVISVHAQYLTVYGGPTYDSSIATGYLGATFIAGLDSSPSSGVQAGTAEKYVLGNDKGSRAVRWDTSGTAVELGNLGTDAGGYTTVESFGINDAGTAIGWAEKYSAGIDLGTRAVRWDSSGTAAIELGNISGSSKAQAYSINNFGWAAGFANKSANGVAQGNRAVRWDSSGVATELDSLGVNAMGITDSAANAINNSGTVVGYANKVSVSGQGLGRRAVRWDAKTTAATELDTLGTAPSGFINNRALAVNAAGTAVGFAYIYGGPGPLKGYRAVRWDASTTAATELDNLGTDGGGSTISNAYAINDSGVAVGYATKYVAGVSKGQRATRWSAASSAVTELGNLGVDTSGNATSFAGGINSDGITVGYSDVYDANGAPVGRHAVMWTPDTAVAVDLNSLIDPSSGWVLGMAYSINNDNWIAGIGGYYPNGPSGLGAYDRFFLIHVPEPTLMSLLVFGMLVISRASACGREVRRAE